MQREAKKFKYKEGTNRREKGRRMQRWDLHGGDKNGFTICPEIRINFQFPIVKTNPKFKKFIIRRRMLFILYSYTLPALKRVLCYDDDALNNWKILFIFCSFFPLKRIARKRKIADSKQIGVKCLNNSTRHKSRLDAGRKFPSPCTFFLTRKRSYLMFSEISMNLSFEREINAKACVILRSWQNRQKYWRN